MTDRPNLAGAGYRRIYQGQMLHLHTISDAAVTLRAWARVIYDDGTGQLLTVPEVARSGSLVAEDLASTDVVTQNGWVVNAEVEMLADGIKRGQTYVRLAVEPFGCVLQQDYCFSEFGNVSLGTFVSPGPVGGSGYLHAVVVKAVGAPAASTSFALRVANKTRQIISYSWLYESSSDADTRVLAIEFNDFLGTPPAGMSASSKTAFQPALLTLTADEDGNMWGSHQWVGKNDNGSLAYDLVGRAPFPIWVSEDQAATQELLFSITDSNANDEDAIYVLVEEWVMP